MVSGLAENEDENTVEKVNNLHHQELNLTMNKTLECFGLQQHVHQSTHYCGHTLDVLISRDTSTIVSNCTVKDIGLCE